MQGKSIGFVGIGNMGTPMTANLIKAGYRVTAFDVDRKAIDRAVKLGAEPASSIEAVTKENETIITMRSRAGTAGPSRCCHPVGKSVRSIWGKVV